MSEDNLAGDLSGDESAAAAEVEGASDDADAAAAEATEVAEIGGFFGTATRRAAWS